MRPVHHQDFNLVWPMKGVSICRVSNNTNSFINSFIFSSPTHISFVYHLAFHIFSSIMNCYSTTNEIFLNIFKIMRIWLSYILNCCILCKLSRAEIEMQHGQKDNDFKLFKENTHSVDFSMLIFWEYVSAVLELNTCSKIWQIRKLYFYTWDLIEQECKVVAIAPDCWVLWAPGEDSAIKISMNKTFVQCHQRNKSSKEDPRMRKFPICSQQPGVPSASMEPCLGALEMAMSVPYIGSRNILWLTMGTKAILASLVPPRSVWNFGIIKVRFDMFIFASGIQFFCPALLEKFHDLVWVLCLECCCEAQPIIGALWVEVGSPCRLHPELRKKEKKGESLHSETGDFNFLLSN